MVGGKAVLDVLISIGKWVATNPSVVKGAADVVAKLRPEKGSKNEEEGTPTVDEKLNQLGAAALELDKKVDAEVNSLRNDLEAACKQIRSMKIMMAVIGAVLGIAVIAIVLLAIL